MSKISGTNYVIRRKLGEGSFGKIYLVEHSQTHEKFAAKFENFDSKCPQLHYEKKLYKKFAGGSHIPNIHWYGKDQSHNIMVIDLLGNSIEDFYEKNENKLSLKTVLMLIDQMLASVEYIHNKNYIHRDIKPDNFMMGTGNDASNLYIIDYGLAKRYRDDVTHEHISFVEGKSFTGTARYASIRALQGKEQSRRDDLEALGYVWIYLLKGKLPWMGISAKTLDEKNKIIAGMKESIPIRELCDGLPEEFVTYMKHVRKLEFEETPNYSLLRSLFRQVFIREKFVNDNVFDWTVQKVVLSKENIAPLMENQITEVKHVREERKRAPCKDEMIIHQKPQPLRHLTPINRMEVIVKTPRDYQVPKLKCKIPQRFLL